MRYLEILLASVGLIYPRSLEKTLVKQKQYLTCNTQKQDKQIGNVICLESSPLILPKVIF